jgi:hypothetical protein
VGNEDIMREQLRKLADFSEMPNVEIFLLPLNAHREPIIMESYTLLSFEPAYDVRFPDVALIDNLSVSMEVQQDNITHMYRVSWEKLRASSLSVEETIRRIVTLADGI